jgi:ubiquinone/menaquinone biosynthesis C-methylase UbiE
MLLQARQPGGRLRLLEADARHLPFRDRSLDLVVLVTALEFLDAPEAALAEAVRVASQGLVLVALNRWSPGAVSRRWGPQSRKPILRHAHDYAILALRSAVARAAGARLRGTTWQSAIFPGPLWRIQAQVPFGEVLGVAAVLQKTGTEGS